MKKFEIPAIEIKHFEIDDIITTSGTAEDDWGAGEF